MKRRLAAAGLAGAALSLAGFVLPMTAASAAPTSALSPARFANSTTTGQAGYFVLKPPKSSSATDTFKVPTVTGCTSTAKAIAPGAYIFTATTVTGAEVVVGCSSGAPVYFGELTVNGAGTATVFTPKPGDTIVATVSVSATASKATLKDVTQAKSKTISAAVGGVPADVLVGMDSLVNSSNVQYHVPKFSTVTFTAAKEDGKTPKLANAVAYNMQTSGGVLQILTSALKTTALNSFTETFKHT
jgi:hypothetical protein